MNSKFINIRTLKSESVIHIRFLILFFAIVSCRGKDQSPKEIARWHFDVPLSNSAEFGGLSDSAYLRKMSGLIGLDSNFDKRLVSFRIWVWRKPSSYVIDINQANGGIKCSVFGFFSQNLNGRRFLSVEKIPTLAVPKNGWESFFNQIHHNRYLDNGPSSVTDTELGSLSGYDNISIELLGSAFYNTYKYPDPEYFRYVDDKSANICRFLFYIEKEFDFDFYNISDSFYAIPVRPGVKIPEKELEFLKNKFSLRKDERIVEYYSSNIFKGGTIATNFRLIDYQIDSAQAGSTFIRSQDYLQIKNLELKVYGNENPAIEVTGINGSIFNIYTGAFRTQSLLFYDSSFSNWSRIQRRKSN